MRLVVEEARLAPGQVARDHQEAHRGGADAVEIERGVDQLAQRLRVEERAGAIEGEQGEPARQQAREEHAGAERVDPVAREPAPQRLQAIHAAVGDHGRVQRARGGAGHQPDRQAALHEDGGDARLVGALGAAAREHERGGRVERARGRPARRTPPRSRRRAPRPRSTTSDEPRGRGGVKAWPGSYNEPGLRVKWTGRARLAGGGGLGLAVQHHPHAPGEVLGGERLGDDRSDRVEPAARTRKSRS